MERAFHENNRRRLYDMMLPGSILLIFSGEEIRKTNDEYYPFFADRNFYFLTGLTCKEAVLMAVKDGSGTRERLYLLPPDPLAERWTGRRVKPAQAEAVSGVRDIRGVSHFHRELHDLLSGGHYSLTPSAFSHVYLDLFRASIADIDRPAHRFTRLVQSDYPFLHVENASLLLRKLRLIKQPCEIEALRRAEEITGAGILAMMRASRPGLWEYQLKAEWEHAIGQYGVEGDGFPPIISAGANNFCIHYYSYDGQARGGDMVLADVGAMWDGHTADVSRGWPVNGRFTDRQKRIFNCLRQTSDHLFSLIRPGFPMADVDATIRAYNAQLLQEAGVLADAADVGRVMWHGGAHHIGYDVHDVVERPERVAPGMVFCVDIGVYHEAWGIGFRLEDNCLVTEDGCENLSAAIPRSVEDIEDILRR